MFIPLYDGMVLKYLRAPYATYALILANCLVYLAISTGLLGDEDRLNIEFGVIPAVLAGKAVLAPNLALVPTQVTILTAMFIHAGFFHLFGNMLFLWVFADNVEDAMGSLRFTAFYLACGFAAAFAYALMLPESQAPLIGASGAVSGVVVAYLLLYPKAHVFGLVFDWLPLSLPAIYCVGAWIVLQFGGALLGGNPEVGWWAHVGGIAAGIVLTPFLKRREVPLFGPR